MRWFARRLAAAHNKPIAHRDLKPDDYVYTYARLMSNLYVVDGLR